MSFTSSLNYTQTITQDASGSLILQGSGSTGRTDLFTVNGNNGTLFSVSDDLSDSLFSVNTIAGLPVIEAFANNTVVMGQYGQNVLVVTGSSVSIGSADSAGAKLRVNGTSLFDGEQSIYYTNATQTMVGQTGYSLFRMYGNSNGVEVQLDAHAFNSTAGTVGTFSNSDFFIKSNNTNRIAVKAGGNVGIGTTSPAYLLSINGTTSIVNNSSLLLLDTAGNPGFQITNTNSNVALLHQNNSGAIRYRAGFTSNSNNAHIFAVGNDTEIVRFTNDGNVGIGTTSPGYKLDVTGEGRFTSGLTSATGFQLYAHYFYNGGGTNDIFASTTGNAAGSGNFAIVNTVSTANTAILGASNGFFRIGTTSQTAATADRLVVNLSNGNVGIGTTNPGYKLQVQGTSYFSGLAYFGQTAAGGSAFRWGAYGTAVSSNTMLTHNQLYNGSGWTILDSGIGTTYLDLGSAMSNPYISFGTGVANTEATEKMRITNSGDVGIGTTSPGYKLDVNGSGRFIFRNNSNEIMDLLLSTEGAASKSKLSLLWYGNETAALKFARGGNSTGGSIEFWTQLEGSSTQQRMVINSNGTIDIIGGVLGYNPADSFTLNGKTQPHYGFNLNPAGSTPIGISGYYGIALATEGAERFRILGNGNVGIGTTNPGYKLEVNGTSYFGNDINVATDIKMVGSDSYIWMPNNNSLQTGFYDPVSGLAPIVLDGPSDGIYIGNNAWWSFNTNNNNDYNENIRLFPSANGVSVIAFRASGAGGTPSNSLLGYSDRFEIRQGNQWQLRSYADYVEAYGSFRAPIFYDSNDTGYYLDPNSSSNLNTLTESTRARWGEPRWWHNRTTETADGNYWTGTNGWGTTYGTWATAWKGGFSGWDIWGNNTDHPQGSGYIHAQGILSGQHYATSNGSDAYGWMMVGANEATANRYWLRGKWGGTTSSWVEMITTGNIGAQSVNYASSAGNADTLDTYHETAFVRLTSNSNTPTNGAFAIGTDGSRNFIQSHSGRPLDINPLGNTVTISSNVGIGTTSPGARLELQDTANSSTLIITADGANEQLKIRRYSNTNEQLIFGFSSSDFGYVQAVEQGVSYRPFALNPYGGNVGVGTTSPSYKLDVNGATRIVGAVIGQNSSNDTRYEFDPDLAYTAVGVGSPGDYKINSGAASLTSMLRIKSTSSNGWLSSSVKYFNGTVISEGLCAEVISTAGTLVFLTTDGEWGIADADVSAKSVTLLGIALNDTSNIGDKVDVLIDGIIALKSNHDQISVPASPGAPLFVSTNAGNVTEVAPAGTGDIVRLVGHNIWSATSPANTAVIRFQPDATWIEL